MKNIIESKFTEAEINTIKDLISQLETAFAGKFVALTDEERVLYGSVNEQNKLFVNKVRDYHQNLPAMSSPDVDWEAFESDYNSRNFLEGQLNRLASLVYRMQSTKILHDYDNYQDSRRDYAYSKYKKDAGESEYTEKVAQLKQFFPRSGKPKVSDK